MFPFPCLLLLGVLKTSKCYLSTYNLKICKLFVVNIIQQYNTNIGQEFQDITNHVKKIFT